jgi:peptide/nickel transport system permease protein
LDRVPNPPSAEHPLGTVPQINLLPRFGIAPGQDASYQWDVYHTLIWGTRSALRFGIVVTLVTAAVGVLVGAVSGYAGGAVNGLMMRMTDAFLVFPPIAAVWLFNRLLFTRVLAPFVELPELSWWENVLYQLEIDPVMLALIAFSWMPYARIINANVSWLKQEEYVLAARSIGAAGPRILFRHLLPNAITPAVVLAARDVGGLVILATAFIFIGIGGNVAWGILLVGARDYIIGIGGNPLSHWWVFLPVSLALTLFGIGWNLLGDGLNTVLNPRARR